MNSHELQQRIQNGDRDAFRTLYSACGPRVYQLAYDALGDESATRSVVKQVFLTLHREIQRSTSPLDIDARLSALTREELRTARLLSGDFTAVQAEEPAAAAQNVAQPDPQPVAAPEPAAPQLPPLQRAEAYMEAERKGKPGKRDKRAHAPEEERPHRSSAVITVLIVLFLLMFLWVLAGILMDFAIIPRFDLGYQWFNDTVFPLFSLS